MRAGRDAGRAGGARAGLRARHADGLRRERLLLLLLLLELLLLDLHGGEQVADAAHHLVQLGLDAVKPRVVQRLLRATGGR